MQTVNLFNKKQEKEILNAFHLISTISGSILLNPVPFGPLKVDEIDHPINWPIQPADAVCD